MTAPYRFYRAEQTALAVLLAAAGAVTAAGIARRWVWAKVDAALTWMEPAA